LRLSDLSSLDLHLLPSLLRTATALDPKFLDPYYYGAVILPDVDANEAIELLNQGIAANPEQWKLYQHLGYIYWQRREYQKASEVYETGAKLPNAPPWMLAMSARMKAEGGASQAAREMYAHLYEASDDLNVKRMVEKQLMRLDSLDERGKIRQVLSDYAKGTGRCAASWKEVAAALRAGRVRLDASGAPIDPSNTPYRLISGGCDVDLDQSSPVPH
jgi:tetratricopeptide (TPR) repeat protein